jgi:hypothetical protein
MIHGTRQPHTRTDLGRYPTNAHVTRQTLDIWSRRVGALVVAAVAAYASYQHQRAFALHGGADATSAGLWPLSVDGLLLLSTAGLLTTGEETSRRMRVVSWLAFGLARPSWLS